MTRIALDANLLLLLLIGVADPRLVPHHRRLKAHDVASFDLLLEILGPEPKIVTTPNILTEVSNLLSCGLRGAEIRELRRALCMLLDQSVEVFNSSRRVAADDAFVRLGLTDAVLLRMTWPTDSCVLTDDLDSFLACRSQGITARNFTTLREDRGVL